MLAELNRMNVKKENKKLCLNVKTKLLRSKKREKLQNINY